MGTLSMGAKNAVEVCMGVKPAEHVLIVTDKGTYPVGNALKVAAERITRFVDMHVLEDYGTRPMLSLPENIENARAGAILEGFKDILQQSMNDKHTKT
jgi:hypothetical protein